jgi:cytokinin dehydrogenase
MSTDFDLISGGASCNGSVFHDGAYLDECSRDYGGIEHRRPRAVMRPGQPEDIAALIREARRQGFPIAARGRGHSVRGQSLAAGGIVVDMRSLSKTALTGDNIIEVEAGADWQKVLDCSLMSGLWPPVIPNYLGLSVGGTLSVGGIGEASFRHGLIADSAVGLDVVTGRGELVNCSARQNSELFTACKGGLGQFGIIVSARLLLVRAPAAIRVFHLLYAGSDSFFADFESLALSESGPIGLRGLAIPNRRDYLEHALGAAHRSVWVSPTRFPWLFLLTATFPESAARTEVVTQLKFIPGGMRIEELSGKEMAGTAPVNRTLSHPWLDLFIPAKEAPEFVGRTLASYLPDDIGGPILLYPIVRSRAVSCFCQLPQADISILLSVSRSADPADCHKLTTALIENRKTYADCRKVGGVSYPIGAIGLEGEEWRNHFGQQWPEFRNRKRIYDPDCVLTPGQKIY